MPTHPYQPISPKRSEVMEGTLYEELYGSSQGLYTEYPIISVTAPSALQGCTLQGHEGSFIGCSVVQYYSLGFEPEGFNLDVHWLSQLLLG